jgi:hypothetical protein
MILLVANNDGIVGNIYLNRGVLPVISLDKDYL